MDFGRAIVVPGNNGRTIERMSNRVSENTAEKEEEAVGEGEGEEGEEER